MNTGRPAAESIPRGEPMRCSTVRYRIGALSLTIAALVLLTALAPPALAQQIAWTQLFDSNNGRSEHAEGLATDPSGAIYIIGEVPRPYPAGDPSLRRLEATLWKYAPDGQRLWVRGYGDGRPNDSSYTQVAAIAVGRTGDVHITGKTDYPVRDSVYIRKYSPSGDLLWDRTIPHAYPWNNYSPGGIAVDDDANVYVGGDFGVYDPDERGYVQSQAFLWSYDAQGNYRWAQEFGGPDNEGITGIAVSGSSLYAAGRFSPKPQHEQEPQRLESVVWKFDLRGVVIWSRQFTYAPVSYATSVAVDPAGDVYVAGLNHTEVSNPSSPFGVNGYLRKYGANGTLAWDTVLHRVHGQPRLAVQPSGHVAIAAVVIPDDEERNQPLVWVVDGRGLEIWRTGSLVDHVNYVAGVVADRQGNLYAVGDIANPPPGQTIDGWRDIFLSKILDQSTQQIDSRVRQISATGTYLPNDPRAPAGVYRVTFGFRNGSTDTFTDIQARITELSGGHTVVNRDGAPSSTPSGTGATVSVPNTSLGPDGLLTPNETFTQIIEIGLQRREGFRIAFTGSGTRMPTGSADTASARSQVASAGAILTGGGEFALDEPQPSPSATPPTASPTPSATPPTGPAPATPTPSAATGCAPRPRIEVRTDQRGPGIIEATITTEATAAQPSNAIQSVRITSASNASVQVADGSALRVQQAHIPAAGSREVRLLVSREQPGPMTAQLEIVDACGPHATFVGAGAGVR